MKLVYMRSIIMLITSIILTTTSLYAEAIWQRPNRRARKQYTSPEVIKAQNDSLNISKQDSIFSPAERNEEKVKTPPTHTQQQIDSALAMWRATTAV